MHMPDFPDDPTPSHNHHHDFLSTFGASLAGGYIGHKFDQSRAGVWFNNNATIDRIWRVMVTVLRLSIVAGILWFMFILFFLTP